MKKNLLLVFLLVAASAIFLVYYTYFKPSQLSTWSFVPSEAICVYESQNFLNTWQTKSEYKIWKNLRSLPGFELLDSHIQYLDSAGGLQRILADNPVLVSFHNTSKQNLGALICVEIKSVGQHAQLGEILHHFSNVTGITEVSRNYLGHDITELSIEEDMFSYIFYKNFFIGSFTPFLVEDAIRTVDERDFLDFSTSHEQLFKLSTIQQDEGNLYVNGTKLAELLQTFLDPLQIQLPALANFTNKSLLDISIQENHILLTGFSLNPSETDTYLSTFDSVQSVERSVTHVVPDNVAALFHYTFEPFEVWHKNLKTLWRNHTPDHLTAIGELENRYDMQTVELYTSMGDEMMLMLLETTGSNAAERVICLRPQDQTNLLGFFHSMSHASTEGDVYRENYEGTFLRHIDIDEVPSRLFGPVFSGFKTTYYTAYAGYVFLASSEEALKGLISNIKDERTWSKSIKTNNFLDIVNAESNLSLIVNLPKATSLIDGQLNEGWREFWRKNLATIKQVEFMAFQFTNVDGRYYTNIAAQHPGPLIERKRGLEFEILNEVTFGDPLASKPFPVRNHNNQTLEMLVQDSLTNIWLVSSTGDTLWNKRIGAAINSEVVQVDYYKNNKLQYLFSTQEAIHMVDRTGTNLPGYPIRIQGTDAVEQMSLIDYDGSKKYRIMVATEDGRYFLRDKNGRLLDGWRPRSLQGIPAIPPFHIRVRSRDYLLFASKNGTIQCLNRRGQTRPGFPIDLQGSLNNPLYIQKGSNAGNTLFTTITQDGTLVQFNLEGRITKKAHVYRASTHSTYKMAIASDKRSFTILRYDNDGASILDMEGQEQFQLTHTLSSDMDVKYYTFGPDNEVIVITDRLQEFTYLYDRQGNMLHVQPLSAGNEVSMLYYESENMYKLYTTYRNKLTTLTLRL